MTNAERKKVLKSMRHAKADLELRAADHASKRAMELFETQKRAQENS